MSSVLESNQLPPLDDSPTLNKYKRELEEQIIKEYEIQMALLRQKANDLFIFNKYILEAEKGSDDYVPLGQFQKEMCRFVTNRSDRKKLLLIPRGHLKTKLITIGYSTMRIALNPAVRGLIYSATWQMAVDIHQAIQKNMQASEKFIELYGDLSKDAKEWSQDRTRLAVNDKREPTITAAGIDNNLVGGHYDFIIMDDVVNRDNINTAEQIQKVINRYKDSLDLLEPNGQLIIIGTRWHDADLYGWILDPENNVKQNYEVMVKQAYEGDILLGDGFQALWPGKFTREDLHTRLKEEGWAHFSAQYLNNPVPEEDAMFKRTWFRYWDSDFIKGKLLTKFLAIDPALTVAKDSDFTAMAVVGVDEHNQIYIIDLIRKKMSPSDILNEMFRLRDLYNLIDIGVETVAYQKTLAYAMRDDERFKRKPFHITELKPNERSKDQRIRGLQPLYENGRIYHNKYLPNNVYLEDELTRYPRSQHDDLIDALSYCLDFIFPPKQAKKGTHRRRYLY